jgi:hypothetical protein
MEMAPASLNYQLKEAVMLGYCDSAQSWLEQEANVNFTNGKGETLLFHLLGNAIPAWREFGNEDDNPEMVKLLLEHGADPAIQDKYQCETALHRATNPRAFNALLTHIPKATIQNISEGIKAIRFAKPQLPRDIRKIIIRRIVNDSVEEHIAYLNQLVAIENDNKETPASRVRVNTIYDIPPSQRKRMNEIFKMLSFSRDPLSHQLLCKQVASNIRSILSIL